MAEVTLDFNDTASMFRVISELKLKARYETLSWAPGSEFLRTPDGDIIRFRGPVDPPVVEVKCACQRSDPDEVADAVIARLRDALRRGVPRG